MTHPKRRRLPPLNALKAFEAAARHQGFTTAAQELSVSAGAISRHVANLEGYFEVALFSRRHNEIELTHEGQDLHTRITAALDVIEDASQRLLQRVNPRQLHISALPTFAHRWLSPRIGKFQAMHPSADIQIMTNAAQTGHADLDQDDIDISVHYSLSDVSGDFCDFLFSTELEAVCSPLLLKGPPAVKTPQDVTNHILLHTSNALSYWRQWFRAAGVSEATAETGLKFGDSTLALQCAIDGVGFACIETLYARHEIEADRLVSPFDLRVKTGNMFFISTNPRRAHVPLVRAFRDWVLKEFKGQSTTAQLKDECDGPACPR